jgi:hypothetical protein
MKKLLFFIILGTCIGVFNLQAQMQKSFSFGLTGNILRDEGSFTDELWLSPQDQSRSMFLVGLYYDDYYFWGNFPIGLFGHSAMHFTTEMDYNGKEIDIIGSTSQTILGLAFYFDISEKIRIVSGIGLHASILYVIAMESWAEEMFDDFNIPEYPMWDLWIGLGIGGKININFEVDESLSFEIGSAFAYDFKSWASLYVGDRYAIHIMPNIGFNIKK